MDCLQDGLSSSHVNSLSHFGDHVLIGDFYGSGRDSITRSVIIDADVFPTNDCQKWYAGLDIGTDSDKLQFMSRFRVPRAPTDDLAALASTTIRVCASGSPHTVGNTFLTFLGSGDIDAAVLKVRPEKYWVSASIKLEDSTVRVKARIYEDAEGHYLLELQRREGCAVKFATFYNMVLSAFAHDNKYQNSSEPLNIPDLFSAPGSPPLSELEGNDDFPVPSPPPPLE